MTIGQSPRADIQKELSVLLGERKIEVKGALDGLSINQVESLVPVDGHDTFHTRLANGDDVVVSKQAVTARLEEMLLARGPAGAYCVHGVNSTTFQITRMCSFPQKFCGTLLMRLPLRAADWGCLFRLSSRLNPFVSSGASWAETLRSRQ